jgi:hypothetical protein
LLASEDIEKGDYILTASTPYTPIIVDGANYCQVNNLNDRTAQDPAKMSIDTIDRSIISAVFDRGGGQSLPFFIRINRF